MAVFNGKQILLAGLKGEQGCSLWSSASRNQISGNYNFNLDLGDDPRIKPIAGDLIVYSQTGEVYKIEVVSYETGTVGNNVIVTTSLTALFTIKGPQGETGLQGPQGPTGETGPQGPQGVAGTNGINATVAGATATVDSNVGTPERCC